MVTRVRTLAFSGIEAVPVDVQVQIGPGAVAFTIVGLPDKAVGESRERVRSALIASGLALPAKRVTVNLAPADLPKEGSHFDLPIALALLAAMGAIDPTMLDEYFALGELSLDGRVASVAGILPAAIGANAHQKGLICPADCGEEAAWADENMDILAPQSLIQLTNHFAGTQTMSSPRAKLLQPAPPAHDFSDIKGQETAKRAMEIAAAGGHHLLMIGPPGAGKSMLAQRMPSILPPLEPAELLEVSMIGSISGLLREGQLSAVRPFRSPHHSASMAALVGGGVNARPGEISLAHNGVLFLDELAEFSPQVLDSLRQPLEYGMVNIARANHRVSYPARVQLIGAMNPCRCGYSGSPDHQCRRGKRCASDYQARISGPFLDRIDLRIKVPAIMASDLVKPAQGESSAIIAERVNRARAIQRQRYTQLGFEADKQTNSQAGPQIIEKIVAIDRGGAEFLDEAVASLTMSARGFHRVLKLARTIADLDEAPEVLRGHIAEALAYRGGDMSQLAA